MKTKNYLGTPDENRGIVIFGLVLIVAIILIVVITFAAKSADRSSNKFSVEEGHPLGVVEKQLANINTFELNENLLKIEGELEEKLSDALLIKLRDIDLVFINETGDVYEYNTDYFISSEKIEFSSVSEKSEESLIDLDKIENGQYYIVLRIKFESNKDGNYYKYYSLKNNTENNQIEYNGMKFFFDSYKNTLNYLKVENI